MKNVTAPLRYIGGKRFAIPFILPLLGSYEEYREPFVGGASVLSAAVERKPFALYWANDLDGDLVNFYRVLQSAPRALAAALLNVHDRKMSLDGRLVWDECARPARSRLDQAARFWLLNACRFNGAPGRGYTQWSWAENFSRGRIEGLAACAQLLHSVQFSEGDYERLFVAPGSSVVIYADPPYCDNADTGFYRGHESFDHERLREVAMASPHRWVLSYDDSLLIRDMYADCHVREITFPYAGNNGRLKRELLISNRPMPQ
ncbi:MAG: DNA adenine methylase [Planctomycetota bacterium]